MSSSSFGDFASLSPADQARVLEGPALQPPPGIESSFDNPPNKNIATYIVLSFSLFLITIAIGGRIGIRLFLKKLFIGDYLLILAYAVYVASSAFCYRTTISPGSFVHQWDIRLADTTSYLYSVSIMSDLYFVGTALVKVIILLEWARIFAPTGKRSPLFWAIHFLIWANIIFYICMIIVYNIACVPHEYLWNKFIHGDCSRVNTGLGNLVASIFNLMTDVLIFLIPQKTIWKLNTSTERKIGISATFAVGFLGVAAAIVRLTMTVIRSGSPDYTYNFSSVLLCSFVETTCAFLVVCIPAFPKAFTEIRMRRARPSSHAWAGRERLQPASYVYKKIQHTSLIPEYSHNYGEIHPSRLLPATPSSESSNENIYHIGLGVISPAHLETIGGHNLDASRDDYAG
ncbi:hypothetical protein F5Y04DRAFT_249404 [Hypomontagnella monticulosa]|nr:hypothetical protein F5Y04DRAFT_249404 [Hypomontagnella monticulosa]